jgi:hypothetical protein
LFHLFPINSYYFIIEIFDIGKKLTRSEVVARKRAYFSDRFVNISRLGDVGGHIRIASVNF